MKLQKKFGGGRMWQTLLNVARDGCRAEKSEKTEDTEGEEEEEHDEDFDDDEAHSSDMEMVVIVCRSQSLCLQK